MDLDVLVSLLLCFSAVCYVMVGVTLLRGSREDGHVPLGIVALVIAVWVFGGALQLAASSRFVFEAGRLGHFIGTALVPVLLLISFRGYTGNPLSRRAIAALFVVPCASLVVAATNDFHQLMWKLPAVSAQGDFLARPRQWGLWFLLLHAPYSYAIATIALFRLVMHSSNVGARHRRGVFALAVAALVPVTAIVVYDLGIGPATISYVPIVFTAMLPVFAWLIVAERVVDFSPIALETVFRDMADPVVVLDDKGRIVSLNRGAEALLNVRESGAFRKSLENLFGDHISEVYEAVHTGKPRRLMTSTGRFLHVQSSPIRGGGGREQAGRVLMFRDVSDVEQAQADVRSSERLLRTLFDHSVNGIVRMRWRKDEGSSTPVLRCVSANGAATGFLKVRQEDMVDASADDVLKMATGGMTEKDAARVRKQFHAAINSGSVVDTEVYPIDAEDGRWLRLIGEPVGDNVAVTLIDVTSTKVREEEMASIASTDPLTAALNRRGFEHKTSTHLATRGEEETGALLFVDLNQFKTINDRFGHDAGDQLLRIAAERLRTSLRSCDIIGRFGGDEFVALVPDVSIRAADELAERLLTALEMPYRIADRTLFCSASIGLAMYPEHGDNLSGLLRAADAAMYRAKTRSYDLDDAATRRLLEKAG
ncbi:MAG: diguanylate cyclase [Woeseiaceae bacterium]|nr:diguanylate cyclase [Woeseiaceae bacterium]